MGVSRRHIKPNSFQELWIEESQDLRRFIGACPLSQGAHDFGVREAIFQDSKTKVVPRKG